MPELTQIYQKQLDESQFCPICQATMYWIEAEYYQKPLNFHQCSHCQHCIFYGNQAQSCQCIRCINQRRKSVQETKHQEKKTEWQKKKKYKEQTEYLLDDLSLLDKLFLLSLLDQTVNEDQSHEEYIDFKQFYPLNIAPSYQLFLEQKKAFITKQYLIPVENTEDKFITHLRLHGYRDPSLLSITQQLRNWFYYDLEQGVPYKNVDEVQDTLLEILFHEVLAYCQHQCQNYQVQFFSNAHFANTCKLLLKQYAVTQLYYWVEHGLKYLNSQKLLNPTNLNFVNTNLLRKTLMQYQKISQKQYWEIPNLPRPINLPVSQMHRIFLQRFLKLNETILIKPFWKSWQEILPRLRFFNECHCIHCGSANLQIEYSTKEYVSFSCLNCKQQDHYFI